MEITKDLLKSWSACRDGYGWFVTKFPQGAPCEEVAAALRTDKRYEDERWLHSNVLTALFNQPEGIADFVQKDVAGLIAEGQALIDLPEADTTDESRLAASGNDSRLAASGNGSRLAASGNDSRLAASGNDSRLAASGYGSRLAASGNRSVAMAAGPGSSASAGEEGAFALAWRDSDQMRIAVGIVGENGIKAGVLYRVGRTGELEEV